MVARTVLLLVFITCQLIIFVHSLKEDVQHGLQAKNQTKLIGGPMRRRRSLTFPDPTDLILIFGLGTPLQLDFESVIIGLFIKLQYAMPTNATDFTLPGVEYNRASRSRWSIYKMVQRMATVYGFGGKECLLRTICEAAQAPFDSDHSLLGQLLQAFLTPSSSAEDYDEQADQEYQAAERLGGQLLADGPCHALYHECPRSILDVFSTVIT